MALVVTIVVLLILAGVSLNLVLGQNGIITKAQQSKNEYEKASINEQIALNEVSDSIYEASRYKDNSGANLPVLTSDLTPVIWNESTKTWDKVYSSTDGWYSYEATAGSEDSKTSRWANAVTPDGSMWVWIPRYAYKITSKYHTGSQTEGGNIEIVFVDKENKDKNGKVYSTSYPSITGDAMDDYVVHPAFVNNTANGGWDSELSGIWVAKFKASAKEGNTNTIAGDNVTNKTLQIKPGVASWRYIQESNMFTVCRNAAYSATNASLLNSHQMKNTEWGAVAYLAQSKYGRNNHEININTSTDYITGGAKFNDGIATYEKEEGKSASTTGNIYGIYDMRGASLTSVAAYIDNAHDNLGIYSQSLLSAEAKYKNVYSKSTTDDQANNYAIATSSNGHFGDAIWETSGSSSSITNYLDSWFYDSSSFPVGGIPIFVRGGAYNTGKNAGILYFNNSSGSYNESFSFRPVLAVL